MASDSPIEGLMIREDDEPSLTRSYTFRFVGDWGEPNCHRVFPWLTQEFYGWANPRSMPSIWSLRDGLTPSILHLAL